MAALGKLTIHGDYRAVTEPEVTSTTNDFSIEVVSGLVDLIPRMPLGTQIYLPAYQVEGRNEIQLIGFMEVTAGSLTIAFNGSAPSAAINWNDTATTVRNKIQALSTVGTGNVLVTDTTDGWYVEFIGTLANTNVPLMVVNDSGLTGDAAVVIVQAGQAIVHRSTSIVMDPVFEARIWEGRLSTINVADTEDFSVPAATTEVLNSLAVQGITELRYDVRHRKCTYAQAERPLRDFSFVATPEDTVISLTDFTLVRGEFKPDPVVLRAL